MLILTKGASLKRKHFQTLMQFAHFLLVVELSELWFVSSDEFCLSVMKGFWACHLKGLVSPQDIFHITDSDSMQDVCHIWIVLLLGLHAIFWLGFD